MIRKIFFDPGHGSSKTGPYDPGAVGRKGLREVDVTLKIAKAASAILKTEYCGFESQIAPQVEEISGRVQIANNYNPDVVVSIHINAAANVSAFGIETYFCDGSSDGKTLAEYVQQNLIKNVKGKYPSHMVGNINRGIKSATFQIIREVSAPAILVECGFISNAEEEAMLRRDDVIHYLAKGIVEGINFYFHKKGLLPVDNIVESNTEVKPDTTASQVIETEVITGLVLKTIIIGAEKAKLFYSSPDGILHQDIVSVSEDGVKIKSGG